MEKCPVCGTELVEKRTCAGCRGCEGKPACPRCGWCDSAPQKGGLTGMVEKFLNKASDKKVKE